MKVAIIGGGGLAIGAALEAMRQDIDVVTIDTDIKQSEPCELEQISNLIDYCCPKVESFEKWNKLSRRNKSDRKRDKANRWRQ